MDAPSELPTTENASESSAKAPLRPTRWQLLNASPWMKGVRLTGFVAAIAALGVGLTYSRVRGQVGEQMITMGESLMRYERAERQDAPRERHLARRPRCRPRRVRGALPRAQPRPPGADPRGERAGLLRDA
jgi:hypothetical protein